MGDTTRIEWTDATWSPVTGCTRDRGDMRAGKLRLQAAEDGAPTPGALNVGHGHVIPRPDGVRARCGGPGLCRECSRDLARQRIPGGEA